MGKKIKPKLTGLGIGLLVVLVIVATWVLWALGDSFWGYMDEQWSGTLTHWQAHPENIVLLTVAFGILAALSVHGAILLYRHMQTLPKKDRSSARYWWAFITATAAVFLFLAIYFIFQLGNIIDHYLSEKMEGTVADWEQHGEYVVIMVFLLVLGITILAIAIANHLMKSRSRSRKRKSRE